jgi:hypothetical protein
MAQFGYGPKKNKTGKRDLRGVDPNAKIGGGGEVYLPGGPISSLKPVPIIPKPIVGKPERPISAIIDEIIKKPVPPGADQPKPQPKPEPGKPSPIPGKPIIRPLPPGRPIRPIRPKPNPIDIITKRFNDPNGFYNNPKY